jgi:hypothetical protein
MTNPMTATGDVIYGGLSGAATRLAGNTTTTKEFLTQTGMGAGFSAAPAWGSIAATDLPTVDVPHGGTGQTTLASHGVVIGAGTSAVNVTAAGSSGQPLVSNGASADPTYQTLPVSGGGTGATTLTTNGVLYGVGTGAVSATAAGTTGQVLTATTGSAPTFQAPAAGLPPIPGIVQGRLTLTSGTPVTTTDVTGASTLYFTPYKGNILSQYSGTAWSTATFSEFSLALSGMTTGTLYDVVVHYVGGSPTLIITAWSGNTPPLGRSLQNGVPVISGELVVGTIYAVSATTATDSIVLRGVWNYYNRVDRSLIFQYSSGASWTYGTASTWRQVNNVTAARVQCVLGYSEDLVNLQVVADAQSPASSAYNSGIGIDSTTTNSATLWNEISAQNESPALAQYSGYPGVGFHSLNWLEYCRSVAGGANTVYGTTTTAYTQSGMNGTMKG